MKIQFSLFISVFFSFVGLTNAQDLIQNGGFEQIKKCPKDLGFFTAKQWNSVSRSGTPDLYSTCVPPGKVPSPTWAYCQVKPFEGKNFAGIITHFHRETYREYIYTKLNGFMIKDSLYELSIALSVSQLARFKQQYLDIVFTDESLLTFAPKPIIDTMPSLTLSLDSLKTDGEWRVFKAFYVANGSERFMNIGNFHSKTTNSIEKIPKRSDKVHRKIYNSAYICIDEIHLKKVHTDPPSNNKSVSEIQKGSYTLKDFEFESGSFLIDETELPELDSLAIILVNNKDLKLTIEGHTDNSGDFKKNKELSYNRAKSIGEYLLLKGISEERITLIGYGSEYPIAENQSSEGRRKNRRVVFKLN